MNADKEEETHKSEKERGNSNKMETKDKETEKVNKDYHKKREC